MAPSPPVGKTFSRVRRAIRKTICFNDQPYTDEYQPDVFKVSVRNAQLTSYVSVLKKKSIKFL